MNAKRPVHTPMDRFPVQDGELQIGWVPLTQLAAKVGKTPFYAYDRRVIREQVEGFRKSLPAEIKLHYAVKANPMPEVIRFLATLVDGLDVASLGELQRTLDSDMPPEKISFAGPGKSDHELSEAITAGVTINMESEGEMERIAALGGKEGQMPRVAVRVNPDFELKSSGMKMGGGPKQFGVDAERVPAMLGRIGELGLDFQGLHIFCGSQNLRPEAIVEAHNKTFDLAFRLAEQAPSTLTTLNIGGGFGIPYFPGDQRLDLTPIASNLNQLVEESNRRLPQTEIVIELGRYLVGEAGIYVCKVIDKKPSRGELFLITNGGLHHHLAASGNFGQVIRKNYPVVVGNRMGSREREMVNVVGPLCTPLDIIADKMELSRAEVGDLIVVYQSGAYGFTASPRSFLSHPEPGEILV